VAAKKIFRNLHPTRMTSWKRKDGQRFMRLIAALAAAALAGCAVGPDFRRPASPVVGAVPFGGPGPVDPPGA
jgi:hypothetical protein